jgi:hypothetical protein
MKDRRIKQVFLGIRWGGRHKEWVNEGEYGECILYPYIKIKE